MPRRQRPLLELMVHAPWWAPLSFALVSYVGLKYVAPALLTGSPVLVGMAKGASFLAPLAAFVFMLCVPLSLLMQGRKRQQLDQQTGIDSIRSLTWLQFEWLMAEFYRRQGFRVVETGGAQPDGGVDIRLHRDGDTTLVQCKHWRTSKVGVAVVRELLGVITSEQATAGILVTTGSFTEEARNFALRMPIELVDGAKLTHMVIAVNGYRSETSQQQSEDPACPKCGRAMVRRVAQRGKNAGSDFWVT